MHEVYYPETPDSPETEVVLRWFECEEGMQDLISDLVHHALQEAGTEASEEEKLQTAARALREFVASRNPLRGEVSLYSQLIEAALDRVNWQAIAEWLLPHEDDDGGGALS